MTGHSPHISRVCPGLADMTRHLSCPARQVENWMNIFSSVVFVKWQNISAVESASINALVTQWHPFSTFIHRFTIPSQNMRLNLTQKCFVAFWKQNLQFWFRANDGSKPIHSWKPLLPTCFHHQKNNNGWLISNTVVPISCHSCH